MIKKRLLTDRTGELQERIIAEQGEALAREIDREVLWGFLKEIGWSRVTLSRFQDNNHAVDITCWLDENIKNPYERNGADFIFESKKDAIWFILRWM
jgi:hypothetical protein